jgi:hypothetical protein
MNTSPFRCKRFCMFIWTIYSRHYFILSFSKCSLNFRTSSVSRNIMLVAVPSCMESYPSQIVILNRLLISHLPVKCSDFSTTRFKMGFDEIVEFIFRFIFWIEYLNKWIYRSVRIYDHGYVIIAHFLSPLLFPVPLQCTHAPTPSFPHRFVTVPSQNGQALGSFW